VGQMRFAGIRNRDLRADVAYVIRIFHKATSRGMGRQQGDKLCIFDEKLVTNGRRNVPRIWLYSRK
jgi:hypothetical protein